MIETKVKIVLIMILITISIVKSSDESLKSGIETKVATENKRDYIQDMINNNKNPLGSEKSHLLENNMNNNHKLVERLKNELGVEILNQLEQELLHELTSNYFKNDQDFDGLSEKDLIDYNKMLNLEPDEHDDSMENYLDAQNDDYFGELKRSSKKKRSRDSSDTLKAYSKKQFSQMPLDKYKKILLNLVRKNSLYNTLPIDTESFAKYMDDFYLSSKGSRSSGPFKASSPTKDSTREPNSLLQKMKRAACGNLNGNPMHRWICW